jgi:hypothetical protein
MLLAALLSGCAKYNLSDHLPWVESEPEPQVPERVVVVWSDAVLHNAGKPSVRGFGGRLMFYGDDPEQPVKVDGQLTVYAFDDENPDPQNPTPEKKFVFPRENVEEHYSESSLGPSYSFWLPWNEVGGFQRQLSLVARFQDVDGKVVVSKIAHVTLPGNPRVAQASDAGPVTPVSGGQQGVRQASFETQASAPADTAEDKPHMQTTTIHVTPGFAHKVAAAAAQEDTAARQAGVRPRAVTVDLQPAPRDEAAEEQPAAEDPAEAQPQQRPLRLPVGFRSVRDSHPVQNQPESQPASDHARTPPRRAEWLRRLPPTPRSGWSRPRIMSNSPAEPAASSTFGPAED